MNRQYEKLFLSEAQSELAKKKGFKEPCLAIWEDGKLFPMVQDVSVIRDNHAGFEDDQYAEYSNDDTVFIDYKGMRSDILAPTHQQIIHWLIHKHFIQIELWVDKYGFKTDEWRWKLIPLNEQKYNLLKEIGTTELVIYHDYYECLNKVIEKALELI